MTICYMKVVENDYENDSPLQISSSTNNHCFGDTDEDIFNFKF